MTYNFNRDPDTSTLVVFTFRYPYGKGEPFFAAEVPYLASRFRRVVIQPLMSGDIQREVPAGVEVCPPIIRTGHRLSFYLGQIFKPSTWWLALKELLINRHPGQPIDLMRLVAWAGIRQALERSEGVKRAITDAPRCVAYCYWGHTPALAIEKLRLAGVRTAVRFHRVDLYAHGSHGHVIGKSREQSFPFRRSIAAADKLVFISQHGRDYFLDRYLPQEPRPKQVEVGRLGTPDYGHAQPSRSRTGPLVLASCSRIVPVKRVDLIARLAIELSQSRPVVWHHFGAGQEPRLSSALKAAQACPTLQCVQHGWVEKSELMEFFRTNPVDLFVNLSTSEGVPVSIMEAVSFDIPVLATEVDGTPEVAVPGRSGMLCRVDEAEDSLALARRVERGLSPSGELSYCRPRNLWEERFQADLNFAAFAESLHDLCCDGVNL